MESILYPDILRYIRSYLPLKEAHKFRRVNSNFTDNELEQLYSNQNIIDLAKMGDLIGVQYLLQRWLRRGLEESSSTHIQDDLLTWAACYGHCEIVKYLAEHGANIRGQDDVALRSAVMNGHYEVVKYLVEHGADVHAHNNEALVWANVFGHDEISKYLHTIMKS